MNLPWEPDKGPMSQSSLDVCINVLPLPEGWGPISDLTEYSQSLGAPCKGAWWWRNDIGTFNTIAATQTRLFRLSTSGLGWTDISRLAADTVVNGSFAADASWTKNAGWTIAGGVAVATAASTTTISQAQALTAGTTYKIVFTVSGFSLGGVRPLFTGGTTVIGTTVSANGTSTQYLTAATGNTTLAFQTVGVSTLNIDNVALQAITNYVGPGDGELWTAAIFGDNFYVSNLNDPLQVLAMTSGANFADAPGSPPQAKYVATIGDFLFLAHLKVGATIHPRSWQHSKINDATNWVVDGAPGASDGQDIPDGDDIVALLPMAGSSARVIQRRARRALIFSPGSATAFSQVDIDATRGAAASASCVSLGSDDYFFLSDHGFILNDEYRPIGAERIDTWFFGQLDPARLSAVRATADPSKKLVWVTYDTPSSGRRILGYNWALDRWFQSDEEVDLFVTTVSPGYVLDDLPGVLNDYPTPPVDSPFWGGGIINFGAFKADGKMYLFAGAEDIGADRDADHGACRWHGRLCLGGRTDRQSRRLHHAARHRGQSECGARLVLAAVTFFGHQHLPVQ